MNFKRPSFKRGGPTGIAQLTPRRQGYAGGGNIGGGIISGSNLGTRSGFKYPNFPGFEFLEPAVQNELRSQMKQPKGLTRGSNATRLGLKTLRNFPKTSTAGLMSLPFVLPAGLAYMNKPETLAEKKVMQDYGPIDETFFQYDEYDADRKAASKVGDKISFTDALFMDPETGKYPKAFGRTKDREEIEELFGTDDGFLPTPRFDSDQGVNMEEIVNTMVSDKKTKTKTDDKPEPTFEDTYEAEKKKIEKLIGADDNKGIVAIALSDAIGTPGTIAEKAAVLNKALLGIMVGKKKDKKEIAMLAYKATKQIETAKITANKEGFSERQLKEMINLQRIMTDTSGAYSDAEKAEATAMYRNQSAALKTLGGKSDTPKLLDPAKGIAVIDTFKKAAKKLAEMDKTDPNYARSLEEYKAFIQYYNNYPSLMASIRRIDAANIGALGKKDGGRIGFANGTPMEEITETETVETSGTPTAQVSRLSFEELRNRLPQEVTDDVIRFLSQSEQALQDFAYIRTAGDIKKFNMKYGLNLVLPAQA